MTTWAPLATSARVVTRPSPPLAPVITATRPVWSGMSSSCPRHVETSVPMDSSGDPYGRRRIDGWPGYGRGMTTIRRITDSCMVITTDDHGTSDRSRVPHLRVGRSGPRVDRRGPRTDHPRAPRPRQSRICPLVDRPSLRSDRLHQLGSGGDARWRGHHRVNRRSQPVSPPRTCSTNRCPPEHNPQTAASPSRTLLTHPGDSHQPARDRSDTRPSPDRPVDVHHRRGGVRPRESGHAR